MAQSQTARPTSAVGISANPRLSEQNAYSSPDSSAEAAKRRRIAPNGDIRNSILQDVSTEDDITPIRETFRGERSATAEPFHYPQYEHRGLTRSSSSLQMRDLTDKMKDLKGKISSLRDQAREDNMRRRSMQSLRTPSPFTAADSWSAPSSAYKAKTLADEGIARSPWNGEESLADDDESREELVKTPVQTDQKTEASGEYQDVSEGLPDGHSGAVRGPQVVEGVVVGESIQLDQDKVEDDYPEDLLEDEEEMDYPSESDSASLYHDAVTAPISHEDREDAFDYEHFFLHSAMGTISQQKMNRRDSNTSFSSEESVATARGPNREEIDAEFRSSFGHLKNQKSTDSVSTMNTFATAAESYSPDEKTIIEYETNYQDVNLLSPVREERAETPVSELRSVSTSPPRKDNLEEPVSQQPESDSRPASAPHYSQQRAKTLHRPSISSFASSNGTTRSFPLVNRPKTSMSESPVPSPSSSSHRNPLDQEIESRSTSVESAVISNPSSEGMGSNRNSPVADLARDDQILVERLVAGMGKCVLGLQEEGRNTVEGRMWRRRLEAARKVLEGETRV